MGVSSDTHASSTSATNTPEVISQIKKQRTCQIPEQKNGMVETRKARRTDLRMRSHSKRLKRSVKTKKQSDQKAFCRLMIPRTGEKGL